MKSWNCFACAARKRLFRLKAKQRHRAFHQKRGQIPRECWTQRCGSGGVHWRRSRNVGSDWSEGSYVDRRGSQAALWNLILAVRKAVISDEWRVARKEFEERSRSSASLGSAEPSGMQNTQMTVGGVW